MPRSPKSDGTGWLTQFRRGVLAGASIPVLALVLVSVPVLLAWIVPGSDSVPASSAVRAAAVSVLAGLRGGIVLDGTLTTLPPLTVTVLLAVLVCGPARRMESGAGLAGVFAGFPATCALLANALPLGRTYAPVGRTTIAAAAFVVCVGGAARLLPGWWLRGGVRVRMIARSAGAVLLAYAGVSAGLIAISLMVHLHQASGLQSRVAPGAAGLAILLLGIGVVLNAMLMSIGYLVGPGFDVGSGTSVSVLSAHRGALPDFPLLAAVPGVGGWSILGSALVVITTLLVGAVVNRSLRPQDRGWQAVADCVGVAAAVGFALALSALLAGGGIGSGALSEIGVVSWQVGGCAFVAVLAGSGAWAAGLALAHLMFPGASSADGAGGRLSGIRAPLVAVGAASGAANEPVDPDQAPGTDQQRSAAQDEAVEALPDDDEGVDPPDVVRPMRETG